MNLDGIMQKEMSVIEEYIQHDFTNMRGVCVCVCVCEFLSHVWFFVNLWTVDGQAPLAMKFSRQEYRSGLPFLSPRDLPNPGIEPESLALQADSLPSKPLGKQHEVPD